jgi:diguanylate cyclase (GGDEF)-like protein
MIAIGKPASEVYDAIALMYEQRNPGMRCSMLELHGNILMHGGAPSLPSAYCEAVHGLENGPEVGSCGASTYTGIRVLVEDIATDPKWADMKQFALPHGLRSCWSEPIKNSKGLILGAFGMYHNYPALPNESELNDLKSAARLAGFVMERDHDQKHIRKLAYTDELTGLSSRAHFYLYVTDLIEVTQEHNNDFCLLYLDLDNFKDINDSLGHDAGDILLKTLAKRLRESTPKNTYISRMSGDEFAIIIKNVNVKDKSHLAKISQSCLDHIAHPINILDRKITPSCSIGIACYPSDGKDLITLLKVSDISLYEAKDRGKNQYVFYKKELTQKVDYRFQIEHALKEAIEKKELSLVYQPQIDIQTGKIIGTEVLSRWHHPKLGSIIPSEFIPIAERIGMIKPLTDWILQTACNQAIKWRNEGLNLRMAVNISPKHFIDNDFVPMVQRILDETGMIPSQLELEVTESTVQTDPKNLKIFQALKDLGILLAIDDFGTGYSSLASLNHLNVDSLKIDKHFIDDLLLNNKTKLLVGSMIEMGHNLDCYVLAEGVETLEQYTTLKKLRCDAIQGYLFSKPVTADIISKTPNYFKK